MKRCFKCHSTIDLEEISFRDECPYCKTDLHVCLNCKFYNSSKHNSCDEPNADFVREKDRANYCEYFKFAESKGEGEKKAGREEAERLWKTIFKKSS